MQGKYKKNGSVFLVVIFAIALLSTIVAGILQLNTEETQLMHNHIGAVEAMTIAEAGLDDAFCSLRSDPNWNSGFSDKSFGSGSYTVSVVGSPPDVNVASTGTNSRGYTARLEARLMIGAGETFPNIVRIDSLGVNE